MSLWSRLRGLFGGEPAAEGEEREGPSAPVALAEGGGASSDADALGPLEEMASGRTAFDEAQAVRWIQAQRGGLGEARALESAVRLVSRHPGAHRLRSVAAASRAERGDDEGAAALLAPFLDAPDLPTEARVLAAEVAERRGRGEQARRLFERVLARDASHAGALAALRRLEGSGPAAPSAGATLMTATGPRADRYRVEAELGRGGAGTVFIALDTHLDRRIALKVYHRRGAGFDARLRAEAATAASMEHPGVVRILDLDEGIGAIAMEWIEGGALRARIGAADASVAEACRWAASLVEALTFVHGQGIVHRDLKPSNVLLREGGQAVLTDFGLALPIGEAPSTAGIAGQGTLRYMPPEQREGAAAAPASDVYALGVVLAELWHAATGPVPETLQELAAACARTEPAARPPLAVLGAELRSAMVGS